MTEKTQTPAPAAGERPQAAVEFIEQGWRDYAEGNYAGALADFHKALELDERLADAQYGLGIANLRQGDRQKALESLEKARLLAKDNTTVVDSARRTILHQLIDAQISIITGNKSKGS